MKNLSRSFRGASRALLAALLCWGGMSSAPASDHADPIRLLDPLLSQSPQEPGITDLHVFTDKEGDAATALVVSLCVRRSLMPGQGYNLEPYTYRVHMDLHARIAHDDPADVARYGGTIVQPRDIAPEVTLEFHLDNHANLRSYRLHGLLGNGQAVVNSPFQPGLVNIATGEFDDPFIFPRFFRTNVIGIVLSIPLTSFPPGQRQWLVWATSAKGAQQIDHVGRSLRTQLPRFQYLNTLPPREHVDAINRTHEHPSLREDVLRTFVSPLFARRYFDAAPDVLIYDRNRPTRFPNGRRLEDDVAKLLSDAGESMLMELSYADSTAFPRATMNDGKIVTRKVVDGQVVELKTISLKPFRTEFPYLAPAWTPEEIAANPVPAPSTPRLTTATVRTFVLIAVVAAALVLTLFGLLLWLGYRWGVRRAGVQSSDSNAPTGPADTRNETAPEIVAAPPVAVSTLLN